MYKRSALLFTIFFFLVAFTFIVGPFLLFYYLNHGNPITAYVSKNVVPSHLESKGYTKDAIDKAKYIQPKGLINKDFYQGHFQVVFKDEPNVTYFYGLKKWGFHVIQFCEKEEWVNGNPRIVKGKTKHSEKKCVGIHENR